MPAHETKPDFPKPRNTAERLTLSWIWKKMQWQEFWGGFFNSHSPSLRRALCWPWPLKKPWQRRTLTICSYGGGLGDELMAAAICREIKTRNPDCRVTILSRFPELIARCGVADEVQPHTRLAEIAACSLRYGPPVPPAREIPRMMAECVGLDLSLSRCAAPQVEPGDATRAALSALPGPLVVVQPLSSKWSPNKNWPAERWHELVAQLLAAGCSVVEVGAEPLEPPLPAAGRFISLVGKTSLADYAWTVSQAAAFIGPVSSGMHLASGYGVPAFIIIGGYEAPTGFAYEGVTTFYTAVPCAPCWIPDQCPHQRRCLTEIAPATVRDAVLGKIRR
jgi:ADP-heptose:LPS heptosyltransferase